MLRAEDIHRLDALGLEWDSRDVAWEGMFEKLRDYRARFGHCNVREGWNEDPALGTWVKTQRRFRKGGTLSAERIQRLESIGFEWVTTKRPDIAGKD
jgi:hypothetical protein